MVNQTVIELTTRDRSLDSADTPLKNTIAHCKKKLKKKNRIDWNGMEWNGMENDLFYKKNCSQK